MRRYLFSLSIALLAATATVATASSRDRDRGRDREHAEDDHHGGEHSGDRPRALGPMDPTYVKECGACHVAYPPEMLPAGTWRAILSGLDRHFGQNAELGPEVRAQLETLLASRAGPDRHGSSMRITEQAWFLDEHDEVPQGAAARPEIRTMANCSACHPGAESWDFDDDRVKIPRG